MKKAVEMEDDRWRCQKTRKPEPWERCDRQLPHYAMRFPHPIWVDAKYGALIFAKRYIQPSSLNPNEWSATVIH